MDRRAVSKVGGNLRCSYGIIIIIIIGTISCTIMIIFIIIILCYGIA